MELLKQVIIFLLAPSAISTAPSCPVRPAWSCYRSPSRTGSSPPFCPVPPPVLPPSCHLQDERVTGICWVGPPGPTPTPPRGSPLCQPHTAGQSSEDVAPGLVPCESGTGKEPVGGPSRSCQIPLASRSCQHPRHQLASFKKRTHTKN